jgi:hypothetical protein
MISLGHIDEVEVDREGAHDVEGKRERKGPDALVDLGPCLSAVVLAHMAAGATQSLDRIEQFITALLAQHVTQHAPQK